MKRDALMKIGVLASVLVGLCSCRHTSEPAIITATRQGDFAEMNRLIKQGADVNVRQHTGMRHEESFIDSDGATPLMIAAGFGNAKEVELLLSNGAFIDVGDFEGVTPLMWASVAGRAENVKVLLAHGADPTAVDFQGSNARDVAMGDAAIIQLLDSSAKSRNPRRNK